MDIYSIILILIVILIPLAGLIAAFAVLWRIFKKGRIEKAIAISIAGLIAYFIITAIWPTRGFYKDEFEYNTSIPFPKSARFVHKSATYPDFHGDYSSEAVFILSEDDFLTLKGYLEKSKGSNQELPWMPKHKMVTKDGLLLWENTSKAIDKHFSWGLLNDGKTAFFMYVQT
jgi:hypothetical protein